MLKQLLHRIVSHPFVYDRVQELAGVQQLYRRIGDHIGNLDQDAVVLDIGGGTGLSRALLNLPPQYLCIDMDRDKLEAFVKKHAIGKAILADGSLLPIRDGTIDLALCVNVAHHLTDDVLVSLIHETMRVLKDSGRFVFVDPVWDPSRKVSRVIWRYDRGSNPRTIEMFRSLLTQDAVPQSWEYHPIHHRYLISVLTKKNGSGVK